LLDVCYHASFLVEESRPVTFRAVFIEKTTPIKPLGVTACKANPLGLQTKAFMDQPSVRICQSAGQHSVHTSQHSCANGLQTRLRANHHCEWQNGHEINALIGTPGLTAV
jgi:hypothetical protein